MEKLVVYENLHTFKKIANGEYHSVLRVYTKAKFLKFSKYRIVQIRVKGRDEFLEYLIKDVFTLVDNDNKRYISILLK